MMFFIFFLVSSQKVEIHNSSFIIQNSFDSLLFQGIQYSYQEDYQKAEESFRKAIELKPGDPAPYLFLTSLYGLYMADFSTDTLKEKFYAYCDTTVVMANRKIESGDSSGLVHLWLAGGYGARAFYKVWHKNILSGIQDGIKSIREFHKAIEIDSLLFDAFIGVAGYDYFKYKLLSFVPWIEDSRWEDEMKLACEKGKYLKTTALAGYALLLAEEEKYGPASELATQLVKKFPEARTFRWIRAKSYLGMEEWELAKDEYKKLLDLTLAGQPENFYNIGCCRIGLARSYLKLGETSKCKTQCEEILKLPDTSRIKEIKEEAKKILKNLTSPAKTR